VFLDEPLGGLPADVLHPVGRLGERALEGLVDNLHVAAHVRALAPARQVHVHLELRHQHDRPAVVALQLHELLDAGDTDTVEPDGHLRARRLHVRQLLAHYRRRGLRTR
jgi:hypothetical protein